MWPRPGPRLHVRSGIFLVMSASGRDEPQPSLPHPRVFLYFVSVRSNIYTDWICCMDLIWIQGWGVAVLVGVPNKDDSFKTHPMNFLNERTLKGTFFGNYKPRTDIPLVVEKYMNKVSLKFHMQSLLSFKQKF